MFYYEFQHSLKRCLCRQADISVLNAQWWVDHELRAGTDKNGWALAVNEFCCWGAVCVFIMSVTANGIFLYSQLNIQIVSFFINFLSGFSPCFVRPLSITWSPQHIFHLSVTTCRLLVLVPWPKISINWDVREVQVHVQFQWWFWFRGGFSLGHCSTSQSLGTSAEV